MRKLKEKTLVLAGQRLEKQEFESPFLDLNSSILIHSVKDLLVDRNLRLRMHQKFHPWAMVQDPHPRSSVREEWNSDGSVQGHSKISK